MTSTSTYTISYLLLADSYSHPGQIALGTFNASARVALRSELLPVFESVLSSGRPVRKKCAQCFYPKQHGVRLAFEIEGRGFLCYEHTLKLARSLGGQWTLLHPARGVPKLLRQAVDGDAAAQDALIALTRTEAER